MQRACYPLMLMLAVSLPGTTLALGLGDLRVDSALNEPLSAQIEIAAATPEELATLTVQLADPQTYLRHHSERPAYLATIRFTVNTEEHGRPVLQLRSSAPCTDPMVELLVDLRWPHGELVRNYSLLLDPTGFAPAARLAPSPAGPAVATVPAAPAVLPVQAEHHLAAEATAAPTTRLDGPVYTVQAHDTLYGIVRHNGAATEADAQRMMIAVFRANPGAFDRNINVLRRGAVLNMPAIDQLASLDAAEARRSVAEQMRDWRSANGPLALPPDSPRPAQMHVTEALDRRVHLLEDALAAQQQQLQRIDATIRSLPQTMPVTPAQIAPAAATPGRTAVAARDGAMRASSRSGGPALGLGLALIALLVLWARRWRSASGPRAAHDAEPLAQQPEALAATVALPSLDGSSSAELPTDAETVRLPVPNPIPADDDTVEHVASGPVAFEAAGNGASMARRERDTVVDYNLADLDATAQFVYMPSELNERSAFVERRTNVLEVLRSAIADAPYRHDLRMKLLETCYGMAAGNRRAFQDYVREQASAPDTLSPEEWQKVAMMCEALGLDLDLPTVKDEEQDDLANCA
jgi:FimV-like protein